MLGTKPHKLAYLLGILSLGFFLSPSMAAERWQVVILADDSHESPIPLRELHNVISRRLTLALTLADFDVHPPQYLGLPNCMTEDCSGLTDLGIRQQALASGKEINLALLYRINLVKQTEGSRDNWRFTLGGRLLDLENGIEQDAFTLDNLMGEIKQNCVGQCFRDRLEQYAGLLAQELGAILSEKLVSLSRRFSYQLRLQYFTPEELQDIHHYLTNLDAYIADTLLREFDSQAHWLHQVSSREYQYVSRQSSSQLGSQIQSILSEQDIPGKLVYENQQRLFTLTRSGSPYLRAYLVAIGTLLLLPLLLYGMLRRRQKQRVLSLENQAHKHIEQGKLAIARHDYEAGETQLAAAITLDPKNPEAQALLRRMGDFQSAYECFQLAQANMPEDPAKALNYLSHAKFLNPQLAALIVPLEQQCLERLEVNPEAPQKSASYLEFANAAYKTDTGASHSGSPPLTDEASAGGNISAPADEGGFRLFSGILISAFLSSVVALGAYWYYQKETLPTVDIMREEIQATLVEHTDPLINPVDNEIEQQKRLELSAWYQAKGLDTIGSYQYYVNAFPQGQYVVYAQQQLNFKIEDRRTWQSAQEKNSIDAYQHYLDVLPMGKFAEQAQEKRIGLLGLQQKAQALQRLFELGDEHYLVQKNYKQAFHYYQQAANQDLAQAQYRLGTMYTDGRGVTKDRRLAARWLTRAAEQGHKQAQATLGYMYSKGLGVAKSDAEALIWYGKAAEQSVITAQYNLAYMYEKAQGVSQNYPQAAFWYAKAAEQGDSDAQNNLGKLYEKGLGVVKDMSKAKALYRQAASQGHQAAKINQLMLDK